jgi:hypothetical protein
MIMPPPRADKKTRKARKSLSADTLYALVKSGFLAIPDLRKDNATVPLADALLSAFAMFSLKDPSLLAFDARRHDANMKGLFGIGQIPSDTGMREILDPLDPEHLRSLFKDVFRQLQRGKALEPFVFYENCYLLSLDGTGYFSSQKIHCQACLEKVNKQTGETTYQHQMLAAALVHPDHQEVIPLAPEPIQKQDGSSKNDCERNAAKRLLRKIRQDHPHLGLIVVEDGLASNGPHVRELLEQRMHFILGVKPGDHPYLFGRVVEAFDQEQETIITWKEGERLCELVYVNQLPLNEGNQDLLVNFLQYSEYDEKGERLKHFSWISDFRITRDNARLLMRGGRARWKIENETFNTLKNQGYHYEHNYGHGEQNLSVVFAMLMMLAFLVDQVQQLCCALFRAVWSKLGSKRALWEQLRSHFFHFTFQSMQHLYEVILYDLAKELPAPTLNTT